MRILIPRMIRKRVFPKMKTFKKVALKIGTLSLWEVDKFKAIAKAVGDRISFCVY